jgi:hypothetical protein
LLPVAYDWQSYTARWTAWTSFVVRDGDCQASASVLEGSVMHSSDPAQELLGPRLTKAEARPLENQAKRHYRAAGRNLARFAADFRRLQGGEAL